MQQTTLTVNGVEYHLAQGQDLPAIKRAVEDAARDGGRLVEFTLAGNAAVSVLVAPGVPLLFEEREIADDSRDDGDPGRPFDPDAFDF